MRECVEEYAQTRGISKSQAESEFKTAVDVIVHKLLTGGVSFKGLFTIKKKVQKGRSGKCSFNGQTWKTEDKNTLSISVGSDLDAELNK